MALLPLSGFSNTAAKAGYVQRN